MAGVVQRLIRHIFGTLANPANIENKQMKIDVGDNGAGTPRDRSRLITQDANSNQHVWVTLDEIEDYVTSEIASSILGTSPSVYILVTNQEDYFTAMELPYQANIYCDDGSGEGLSISFGTSNFDQVISITAPKTICGAGGVAIKHKLDFNATPLAVHSIQYDFPENADDQIYLSFLDSITWIESGSGVGSFTLVVDGSTVGADHRFRLTTIDDKIGRSDISRQSTNGNIIEIEKNLNAYDRQFSSKYVLWSGKNDRFWTKPDTCITEVESNTVLKFTGSEGEVTVTETGNNDTESSRVSVRSYAEDGDVFCEDLTYKNPLSSPSYFEKQLRKNTNTALYHAYSIDGDGHMAIGSYGALPWFKGVNVVQCGFRTMYCINPSDYVTLQSGISTNCYMSAIDVWRFSSNVYVATREEDIEGDKKTWHSTNIPSEGAEITWVEITPGSYTPGDIELIYSLQTALSDTSTMSKTLQPGRYKGVFSSTIVPGTFGIGAYSVNLTLAGNYSIIGNYTELSELFGYWHNTDDSLMEEKTFYFEVSSANAISVASSNNVNVKFKRPSLSFEKITNTINQTLV